MSAAFANLSRLYLEDELLFAFSTLLVQFGSEWFVWGKATRSLKVFYIPSMSDCIVSIAPNVIGRR